MGRLGFQGGTHARSTKMSLTQGGSSQRRGEVADATAAWRRRARTHAESRRHTTHSNNNNRGNQNQTPPSRCCQLPPSPGFPALSLSLFFCGPALTPVGGFPHRVSLSPGYDPPVHVMGVGQEGSSAGRDKVSCRYIVCALCVRVPFFLSLRSTHAQPRTLAHLRTPRPAPRGLSLRGFTAAARAARPQAPRPPWPATRRPSAAPGSCRWATAWRARPSRRRP